MCDFFFTQSSFLFWSREICIVLSLIFCFVHTCSRNTRFPKSDFFMNFPSTIFLYTCPRNKRFLLIDSFFCTRVREIRVSDNLVISNHSFCAQMSGNTRFQALSDHNMNGKQATQRAMSSHAKCTWKKSVFVFFCALTECTRLTYGVKLGR